MGIYLIALVCASAVLVLLARAARSESSGDAHDEISRAPRQQQWSTIIFCSTPIIFLHIVYLLYAYVGWGQADNFNKPPFVSAQNLPAATLPEAVLVIGAAVSLAAGRVNASRFGAIWTASVLFAVCALIGVPFLLHA